MSPGTADSVAHAKHRRKGTLTIRIHIPKKRHKVGRAHYISAATQGMTLSFTGAATVQQAVGLTPTSPGCSAATGSTVCQVSVQLTGGTYQATIALYDAAPVNGSIPLGANQLSTGRGAVTVVTGKSNQFGLTLDGLPATFAITNMPAGQAGTAFASPQPFTVEALDAGGNLIVGGYAVPVLLTNSDTSGATKVVTAGFDAPFAGELLSSSDTAALAYNGAAVVTKVTAVGASVGAILGSGAGSALFVPTGVVAVTLATDGATGATPGMCPAGAAGDLRYAMCAAQPGNTIAFACVPCIITLSAPLPPIEQNLTIDGGTLGLVLLSGNSRYRGFFVDTGIVALKNLEIISTEAVGGAGGIGGGGGGAGLGGGIFINQSSAAVTVTNVEFEATFAVGGNGGVAAAASGGGGGGGGIGAPGAPVTTPAPSTSPGFGGGGGGGVLGTGVAADATVDGGAGGLGGGGGGAGAAGTPFGVGGTGGAGYGGTADLAGGNGMPGTAGAAGAGGNGGFGGGGGGGADSATGGSGAGNGGFGGGGGGNYGSPPGNGGLGGGGGATNLGATKSTGGSLGSGVAGGAGGNGAFGAGGGGAAAGPAIFVLAGTLTTSNSAALSVASQPGFSSGGTSGSADSTPVFNYGGTVNGSTTKGPIASALLTVAPSSAKHRRVTRKPH
jgi:hypothetical protein